MGDGIMTRFNYSRTFFERLAGVAPSELLGNRLRLPVALAGAVALLLSVASGIEMQRLSALDRDLGNLQARLRAVQPAAGRASSVIAAMIHERRDDDRIQDARREAIASTNTIARLGNALPARTWLTNIQSTPAGAWTIAGRSDRVAEIGTTLRTIQQFEPQATAQLVSISAGGPTGTLLNFVIGWQPQQ
jgi:hypothetical protein